MNWNLRTFDAVEYGDFLWFSNNSFNGLFRIHIETKEVEFVDFFPEESMAIRHMHKKCFLDRERIIFIPSCGSNIQIYEPENNSFFTLRFPFSETNMNSDKISDAIRIGDYIYAFPLEVNENLKRLNLLTYEIEEIPEFILQVKQFVNGKGMLLTRCTVDEDAIVHFAFYDTDIVAEWDINSKTLRIEHCGVDDLFALYKIHNEKWMIRERCADLYLLNDKGAITIFPGKRKNVNEDRFYNQVIEYAGSVLILPSHNDCICGVLDNEIKSVLSFDNDKNIIVSFGSCEVSGSLWILPFGKDLCYVLDNELNLLESKPFELRNQVSKERILRQYFREVNREGIVVEGLDIGIEEFLSVVS